MGSREIGLRRLGGSDVPVLQRVLESAPDYTRRIKGVLCGPRDAEETLAVLPPGKTLDDKFVFGVYAGEEMIGCVDLIRGYPDPATAFLGLLLLSEKAQRKGVGAAAFALVEKEARAWGTCQKLRLGVVRTNDVVLPFWRKQGFRETGETKPYQSGPVTSVTLLLEKML